MCKVAANKPVRGQVSGVGRDAKAGGAIHVPPLLFSASMPAHPLLLVHDPLPLDQPLQPQPVCAKCLSTLDTPGLPGPGAFVCPACRELVLSSPRDALLASDTRIDLASAFPRPQSRDSSPRAPSTRPLTDADDSMLLGDAISQRILDGIRPSDPSKSIRKPTLSCITNNVSPLAPPTHSSAHHSTPSTAIDSRRQKCAILDPLVDITRLRVRTSSHHCLYPGATFVGTQKSGRSSYDVAVTVVVRLPALPVGTGALTCLGR
jgi:hypothetical protein